MIVIYKRYENESDDELIYRICKDKDKIGTWYDVRDILNELLGTDYNESAFRKKYQAFNRIFEANQKIFVDSESQLNEIQFAKRELEREKIQFRDERNAWNKQNYADARVNQKLDYLEEQLSDIGKINFDPVNHIDVNSDNDLFIMLADLHTGQTFSSSWGEYNIDIEKERLNQYLKEIIKIAQRHNSENAFVSIQGDNLSGSIHKSVQVTNRENVINQIKLSAELIASFCYELSKYFNKVTVINVSGNHSRIDKKEDALHDERLDDLITWISSRILEHIDNIKFKTDNYDIGIASVNIRGNEFLSVHGDYDSFTSAGVGKLCMMTKTFPYAICYGHLHHSALNETNGIKMIMSGSLAGAGDQYTIEKRLSGKPSQMVCVCNENGIEAYYPIELN